MTKIRSRLQRSSMVFRILGSAFVLAGVVFAFNSLYGSQDKLAKAAALANADLSNLPINCTSVRLSALATSCIFDLQPGQTLPAAVTVGIGNATPNGTCTASGTTSQVTCVNVPIGTAVGIQDINVKIGTDATVNTNRKTYVAPAGNRFVKAKFTFNPDKGGTSPLFRSSDAVTVTTTQFKTDTDPSPAANAYTCTIQARSYQTKTASSNWTTLGSGIPYNPSTGCSAQFTKAQRGNGLNWSVKTTITSIADTTQAYDVYDSFVYRFQGAGVASGG